MTPILNSDRPPLFDLSANVKLRITGADAFRFLNGQITNDLRKATARSAIQASILNAKGKLSAHVFISADCDGAFLLDADAELREDLPARLERYIIADDVQVDDVTEQFAIFHVVDESSPALSAATRIVSSNRFASPGWDVWCECAKAGPVREELSGSGDFIGETSEDLFRIERGVPRWGKELTNEIIPVEANLEAAAIDYAKGCYIGQEVISRMKLSGQTNKRLCGLVSLGDAPLAGNSRLNDGSEPPKDVGWITSAAWSDRLGKQIALGYVKRGSNETGTRLLAGDHPVQVVPLPFT